jgi:hypothetical protein
MTQKTHTNTKSFLTINILIIIMNIIDTIKSIFTVEWENKYRCSCEKYVSFDFMENLGAGVRPAIFDGLNRGREPTNCVQIETGLEKKTIEKEKPHAVLKVDYEFSKYKCADCGDEFVWDVRERNKEWEER